MTNLPPPCKWSTNQIDLYKIHRVSCDALEFFGKPATEFRQPVWRHPEYAAFLQHQTPETFDSQTAGEDQVRELLMMLKSIHFHDYSIPVSTRRDYSDQDTLTDQVIKLVLQFIGMGQNKSTMIRTNTRVLLQQNGFFFSVTMDAAVVGEHSILHLLLITEKENKPYDPNRTSFGQLMACAIGAFQHNNEIRKSLEIPTLDFMIFPAMIWSGSVPSFYRIKITHELSEAVRCPGNLKRPDNDTYVAQLHLPIPNEWMGYGLWRMRNRAIVMKILENMKDFIPCGLLDIPVSWNRFMMDLEPEHSSDGKPSNIITNDDVLEVDAEFD
ncbi:hypothetical protein Clacol_004401 [Clathrus columnatus]|uniref:Uncharacterized protein n=1 Tax=Clathrus columnatus TaxID=1419009 RepID=A0AAV5AB84_9AGAM|nr:hypothetical protein Clacol_004401 [Clathrus columnatus]